MKWVHSNHELVLHGPTAVSKSFDLPCPFTSEYQKQLYRLKVFGD